MGTIFLKVLVIFAMILIGLAASKAGVLPDEANGPLVALLINITMPFMILSSMADITLTPDALHDTWQVMLGSAGFFALTMAVSYPFVMALRYEPPEDRGVLMVIICAVNSGFMGFPITLSIFGKYYLFLMVLGNVLLNVYMFGFIPRQLKFGRKGSVSPAAAEPGQAEGVPLWRRFATPINVCLVLGLIVLFAQIRLPAPLFELIDTVGDATVPISMIVVGLQLSNSDPLQILKNRALVLCSLANVILMPLLTFLAVNWLPISVPVKVVLVLTACFPTAVVPVSLAAEEGANARLMAEGVSLTTLMSLATIPVIATFLIHFYGI